MSNPTPPLHYATATKSDPIWPVTAAGFAVMLFVGIVLSTLLTSGQPATTQPSDVPLPQVILIGYLTSIVTTATLLCGDTLYRPGASREFGLTAIGVRKGFWWGLRAAIVVVPIVLSASYLTELFWEAIHYHHESAHPLLRLFGESTSVQRWAIVILAAVIAPIGEELLFRAHLQTAFTQLVPGAESGKAAVFGIVASSVVFTLFHGELWMMPPLMVLSVAMGTVFHWTRNVFASIAIHVCFNGVSLAYFWVTLRSG